MTDNTRMRARLQELWLWFVAIAFTATAVMALFTWVGFLALLLIKFIKGD